MEESIPVSKGRRKATTTRPPATDTATDAATDTAESAAESTHQRAEQRGYTPEYDTHGRKSADDRPNAFNPLAWLVEGATGLMEEARHGDLGLSEEFWQHFYAARRESLLTARALIDSLLEQTERDATQRKEKEARAKRRGGIAISGVEGGPEQQDTQ